MGVYISAVCREMSVKLIPIMGYICQKERSAIWKCFFILPSFFYILLNSKGKTLVHRWNILSADTYGSSENKKNWMKSAYLRCMYHNAKFLGGECRGNCNHQKRGKGKKVMLKSIPSLTSCLVTAALTKRLCRIQSQSMDDIGGRFWSKLWLWYELW